MTDAIRGRERWLLAAGIGSWAAAASVAPDWTIRLLVAAPPLAAAIVYWLLSQPARWVPVFLAAAILLPPLPIPLGDSGPHIAMAIAGVGLLTGLARLREWRLPRGWANAAIAFYPVALFASLAMALVSGGPALAAMSLARVALFGISVYVYFFVVYGPGDGAGMRWVYAAAVASAAFACLDFYFQFPAPAGFGPQYVWLDSGVFRRAQGVFYEASTLGNFCAFFLTMIAAALLRGRSGTPVPRWLLAGGAMVFLLALILSFSRGSLVNVSVAVITLLILHRRRLRPRLLMSAAGTAVAAAWLAWLALPRFVDFYWLRLQLTVEYFTTATESVLSGRLESWRLLAGFLMDHPWQALAGVGYKTLPYSDAAGAPLIVDNAYLTALAETGVVGLGALIAFNAAILTVGWRAAHRADPRAAFLGSWIFAFWAGETVQMLSGDLLTYWRVLPLYLWVLASAARE